MPTRDVDTPADGPAGVVSSSSPFNGRRMAARVAPFAAGAALAEVSLVLPPGVHSVSAAYASAVLLAATAVGFVLPWPRLPRQAAVAVPVVYCGSALALILAAGRDSGVAVVVLIPLVWTALFHTRWESAVVVAAVVAVEFVVSAFQHDLDATVVRRVVLWALLGAVISVSAHALRDRVRDAQRRSEQLRDQLQQVELNEDRLRIALKLQDDVVNRIFAATLTLRAVPGSDAGERTKAQLNKAVTELDETVKLLRHSVFDIKTGHSLPSQEAGPAD